MKRLVTSWLCVASLVGCEPAGLVEAGDLAADEGATDLADHDGFDDLADDELDELRAGLTTSPVVINEVRNGRSGYVELYNTGTAAVDLYKNPASCFWVDDSAGQSAPKLITDSNVNHAAGSTTCARAGRPATCALLAPGERVWLTYGGFNLSGDFARFCASAFQNGACDPNVSEIMSNGGTVWNSGTEVCFGRMPDGGKWTSQFRCSPDGAPNSLSARVCDATTGAVAGAPCDDHDYCTVGETWSATCACGGATPNPCAPVNDCQVGTCTANGCQFNPKPDGTACGATTPGKCSYGVCVTAPAPSPARVVINEFTSGAAGWVELFNAGTTAVDLTGWSVKDNSATGAKKLPAGTVLAPRGWYVLPYGSINTSSNDGVALRDPSLAIVDQTQNFWAGGSTSGKCFGRLADGGAFKAGALAGCTPGKANASAPPPSTTCTGGTYGGVAFTRDEECKAVAFLNGARYSQLAGLGPAEKRLAYDCEPSGRCGARTGKWQSLSQLQATDAGTLCSFTGFSALKSDAAAWTDDGKHADTVASVWTNRSALQGVEVTFDRVYVSGTWRPSSGVEAPNCVVVRDDPSASGYFTVCEYVNPWCDCHANVKWTVGSWVYARGFVKYDTFHSRWMVEFGRTSTSVMGCGGRLFTSVVP